MNPDPEQPDDQQPLPAPDGELWVFGYGSLLWRPGFDYLEQRRAHVFGYHRSLCVWSHHHRGCPERPGLVFGMDAGGSTLGVVYRVSQHQRDATWSYLRQREMINKIYQPRSVVAATGDGTINALAFVVDRDHRQYAGRLEFAAALSVVEQAHGQSGPNRDYVLHTARQLHEMQIRDPMLQWLAGRLAT